MGGAIIPILLSIYLIYKKKIPLKNIIIAIVIVTIVAFFVTRPVANKGIVATFPFAFFPAIFASIISVVLCWKEFKKAAPLAYISGTIGVLIGADFLHLWELINIPISQESNAVIGGADVFDMVFFTGIIAVLFDGLFMLRQRKNEGFSQIFTIFGPLSFKILNKGLYFTYFIRIISYEVSYD